MREALEHLCAHAGTGAHVRPVPIGLTSAAMRLTARAGLTPFGPYHWIMYSRSLWFDLTEAREELGWSAGYSTDAMFRDSYDWFLRPGGGGGAARPRPEPGPAGVLRAAKHLLRSASTGAAGRPTRGTVAEPRTASRSA